MVKRSHCNSSNSGGGHRRSVVLTVSVLALYAVLCGGAVSGTSLGDRTAFYGVAAPAERADDAAVAAAVAGSTARNGRSATNLSHITGTARKIKMFIKNRYLQVFPDGTVNGTAEDTNDYVILQRTSVNMGQLNIQGVATCMYLCMDACGLLYGSKDFEDECVFNEMIEQNHYNTYSSVKYTNDRRTLYLALNKRGAPRKVQVKADAPLGKLSAYTRVLTQPVPAERVERLLANRRPLQSAEWPASIPHAHRHQHACPPHVGPPHATAKHRKSQSRKCQMKGGGGGGRKKSKDDGNRDGGSREDEDCGGGGNKKKNSNNNNNRCGDGGDEINHRKVDAAGRKKKSKKPTTGGGKGGKGDKPQRQHGAKAGKKSETDAQPPEPAVAVQQVLVTTVVAPSSIADADGGGGADDDDDDDDAIAALAVTVPTDEFLHFNDN